VRKNFEITNTTAAGDQDKRVERTVLNRLEEQIAWYDHRSKLNQVLYKSLKAATITAAAAIPVLTTSKAPYAPQIAAALGVMIAVLEGIQQLNQYQISWTSYRGTAEALKREKYLYLGAAGPYGKSEHARLLLTERVESLVSQENAKWLVSHAEWAECGRSQFNPKRNSPSES
jgi:Protein of unknown function (DUF4231)